ncbi:MAG: hypothetical protein ABIR32_05800, partial [Ilumatobacteraceae bacterium]
VKVGVFYGLPDGSPATGDLAVDCASGGAVTGSILIPLELAAALGERTVESLDGRVLGEVAVSSD